MNQELNLNIDYIYDVNKYQFETILKDFHKIEGGGGVLYKENCKLLPDGKIEDVNVSNTDKKAIYLGNLLNIWGHCITDNLKKFWFLLTPECQKLREDGFELVCTLFKDDKLNKNFVDLLSYLGIKEMDIQIIKEPGCYKTLVVPQDSLNHWHWYYQEFKDTIDHITSQIEVDLRSPKKLYFSRTQLKDYGRRDFGESMIENAFRLLGYTIVSPEKLSLKEQLVLLKSCDSFAATDGSVAHNAMFCRDKIECIVISKMSGAIPYQYSIMGMRQFKSYYIDAHLSIFNVFAPWHGPFYMFMSDNMVRFCQDRGVRLTHHFSIRQYLRYLFACFYQFLRYRLRPRMISHSDYYVPMLKTEIERRFNEVFFGK